MSGGTVREFLLGSGGWRYWHSVHVLLLLPALWFIDYFRHFVPGAGPQGGEAVFVLMLLHMLAFALVSAVNALLLAAKGEGPLLHRLALWPALLLTAWVTAVALVLIGAELCTSPGSGQVDRWLGAISGVLALVVFYGANLAALRRARRG